MIVIVIEWIFKTQVKEAGVVEEKNTRPSEWAMTMCKREILF